MTNPISELDNIVKDLNAAREILESISVNVTFLLKHLKNEDSSRFNSFRGSYNGLLNSQSSPFDPKEVKMGVRLKKDNPDSGKPA